VAERDDGDERGEADALRPRRHRREHHERVDHRRLVDGEAGAAGLREQAVADVQDLEAQLVGELRPVEQALGLGAGIVGDPAGRPHSEEW
jgi:hypothetical protein